MANLEKENTFSSVDARIELLEKKLAALDDEINSIKTSMPENKVTLIISSGDLDKALSSFIIAVGAASMGFKVVMFFTFWGMNIIKKKRVLSNKTFTEKLMSLMLPSSNKHLPVSKSNMFGMGALFLKEIMKEHKVASLQDLVKLSNELGVSLVSCQMTMGIMGISAEELLPDLKFGGVASCVNEASTSKFTLFI